MKRCRRVLFLLAAVCAAGLLAGGVLWYILDVFASDTQVPLRNVIAVILFMSLVSLIACGLVCLNDSLRRSRR